MQCGGPRGDGCARPSPADGAWDLVHYFERARFEWHPENAGTPYEILLGHLGTEMLAARDCR